MYPLQKWYNQLIDKNVSEIGVSDVLRMIRQNEFIDINTKSSGGLRIMIMVLYLVNLYLVKRKGEKDV